MRSLKENELELISGGILYDPPGGGYSYQDLTFSNSSFSPFSVSHGYSDVTGYNGFTFSGTVPVGGSGLTATSADTITLSSSANVTSHLGEELSFPVGSQSGSVAGSLSLIVNQSHGGYVGLQAKLRF